MSKILIITDNLPDQINGVVTTFKNIEACAILDGYSVDYITPLEFFHFGCPLYNEVKLSIPFNIGKKIKALEPDHVHIATEGPLGLSARLWLDRNGWRYNTSYHTKFPEFLKSIAGIPLKWTYEYLRWFHKHSGKVLVTTKSMAQDLKEHNFVADIVEWTRGVDRDNLKPTRNWRPHLDKPRVLYVGRVSKEKNLEKLCELYKHYDITIVGDGPIRRKLELKYIKVDFVGYRSGEELANYYATADVFCFPSVNDTFGIVMIEALSVGTPVAAYPVNGPIDIIENGVTGFMEDDLKSAIDKCLKLNRLNIQRISSKWTWQECWSVFKNNLVDK
jgi:glycosyltransferase involved in cell wall biosynthesis